MCDTLNVFVWSMKSGIRRTPEFARKGLADYAVNVGLKCGHSCHYCSSGAVLRHQKVFREIGRSPFDFGYAIVDPDMPAKVAADARRMRKRGLVQLCTLVDAWCPAAQAHDLGRRCLEALLAEPGWTVRILTKNAAVVEDYGLIRRYRDRVRVGISLTGTPDTEDAVAIVEPNASSITERMGALRQAAELGLRVYGMLCPLLPGIADGRDRVEQLVRFARELGAEEIFAEAVNPRGPGLTRTEPVLREAGRSREADAVGRIRKQATWSSYCAELVRTVQAAARREGMIDRLRFLLYPSRLLPEDAERIRQDDTGVVWLGKARTDIEFRRSTQ